MKYLPLIIVLLFSNMASAQYHTSSEMDAVYMATLKAVVDYKMDDEENIKTLEKLRQDKKFNDKLKKKIEELNNNRSKSGKNKRVYDILKTTGKRIYNELN